MLCVQSALFQLWFCEVFRLNSLTLYEPIYHWCCGIVFWRMLNHPKCNIVLEVRDWNGLPHCP